MKTTTHWMSSLWSKPAHVDGWLLALVGMLLAIGMMVIASSSIEFSSRMYGNPMAVLIRHVVYLSFGLVAALVVSRLPINLWHDFDRLFLLVGTVALIAVLIPGIGSQINGSWRWFRFGPIGVQPSEIMKWFMILFVAGYLARQRGAVKSFWGLMKPVVIMVFVLFLLLLEPDFGAAVVLTAVVMGMMFLGGANFIQFLGLAILGVMLIGVLAYSATYRVARLMAFLDPWSSENVYGSGYQLTQALIAMGRGEWFGVGIGNSMLKLFYLPEAHTDFVFAILGEEYGLVGVLTVLGLFTALISRVFYIGMQAERRQLLFSAFVCYGTAIQLSVQTIINMGVNVGLLPTKGLTLPLLSYGGSSLVVTLCTLGLVFAINNQVQSTPIPTGTDKAGADS